MRNKNKQDYDILEHCGSDKHGHKLCNIKFKDTGHKTTVRLSRAKKRDVVDKSIDGLVGKVFNNGQELCVVVRIDHRDSNYNKHYLVRFLEDGYEDVYRRRRVQNKNVKRRMNIVGDNFTNNKGKEFEVVSKIGDSRYLCYFPNLKDVTAARKNTIKNGCVNPHAILYNKEGSNSLNKLIYPVIDLEDWFYDEIDLREHLKELKLWNGLRVNRKPEKVHEDIRHFRGFLQLVPDRFRDIDYLDIGVESPKRTTGIVQPKDVVFP